AAHQAVLERAQQRAPERALQKSMESAPQSQLDTGSGTPMLPVMATAPPPPSAFDTALDRQALQTAPGARRSGGPYVGGGADEPSRLGTHVGHARLGTGGAGVNSLPHYRWTPDGSGEASPRGPPTTAVLGVCTKDPGLYHMQAKVARGGGQFPVRFYTDTP